MTTTRFNPHQTAAPPTSEAEIKVTQPSTINHQPSTINSPTLNSPTLNSPSGGLKRLSLTGIAKKKETTGKTDYPVLPDPNGKAAEAAAEVRKLSDEFDAIEGSLKAHKKFLIELATPFHFTYAAGRLWEKSIGIMVADARGANLVRLDFKHSYPLLESESPLLPILGERTGELFHQKFEFKIAGDKLPAAHAAEIVAELQSIFAKYNCTDAFTAQEGIAPNDEFHLKRHLLLTAEQNIALQSICPIRAAVATKNIK